VKASEDEDCSGNDLSSREQIDVSFKKILHEEEIVMTCVGASFCAKHCMESAILANFKTFPEIYFCLQSTNNMELFTFILH